MLGSLLIESIHPWFD